MTTRVRCLCVSMYVVLSWCVSVCVSASFFFLRGVACTEPLCAVRLETRAHCSLYGRLVGEEGGRLTGTATTHCSGLRSLRCVRTSRIRDVLSWCVSVCVCRGPLFTCAGSVVCTLPESLPSGRLPCGQTSVDPLRASRSTQRTC